MSRRGLQTLTILVTALPALGLVARFATEGIGANPVDDITHVTGEWGLRWLLACLMVTPLRRVFGVSALAPIRRTLGLAAFAYATIHMATWALLDLGLDPTAIFEDLTERPYILVGMASFLILLALALTSTRGWIKRLGKRWIKLHQLVYVAASLAVLHFFWLVKADLLPPILHGLILAVLLGTRLLFRMRSRAAQA